MIPVPDRAMVSGVELPAVCTDTMPVTAPAAAGWKVTSAAQVEYASSVTPQLLVTAKPDVVESRRLLAVVAVGFERTKDSVDWLPTATKPKPKEEGAAESVVIATPVAWTPLPFSGI